LRRCCGIQSIVVIDDLLGRSDVRHRRDGGGDADVHDPCRSLRDRRSGTDQPALAG
jgi:hypothetical protein